MASLQATSFLVSSGYSARINAAISVPKLPGIRISAPRKPLNLVEELTLRDGFTSTIPIEKSPATTNTRIDQEPATTGATVKLYAILEAVADRVWWLKCIETALDSLHFWKNQLNLQFKKGIWRKGKKEKCLK
ncbi:hypothetical protein OIU85_027167 [Salix viminalis]|uniref:Uncharacterized protein n=1 Tax=Salix viminalis TaxID=40686 RepID=A0A9Q0QHP8_SALVM|nr:hypothetical protein OIU85_027167 [Salix viminalis]